MEIQYKVTTWCKIKFNGNVNPLDIVEKFEDGYLPLEVGYDGVVPNLENAEWEPINDTEDYFPVEKNQGSPTIELRDDNGQIIWDNVNKFNQ